MRPIIHMRFILLLKWNRNYFTLNNGKRYRGHKVSPKTLLEDKRDVQAIAKKKQHVRALLKREDIKPEEQIVKEPRVRVKPARYM